MPAGPVTPSISSIQDPIQYFKGVGPNRTEVLAKIGIRTVEDLLFYFPRDHQDRRLVPIKGATPGARAAFAGEVLTGDFGRAGKMLGTARAILKDGTGSISVVWFKHLSFKYDVFAGLKRDLVPGRRMMVYGTVELVDGGVELKVEDHEALEEGSNAGDRIVPVYPLTEGVTDRWLRSLTQRGAGTRAGP